jgi:hypothetical protein
MGKYQLGLFHTIGNGLTVPKNVIVRVADPLADIQAVKASLAESSPAGEYRVPDIRKFGQVRKLKIRKVVMVLKYHEITLWPV